MRRSETGSPVLLNCRHGSFEESYNPLVIDQHDHQLMLLFQLGATRSTGGNVADEIFVEQVGDCAPDPSLACSVASYDCRS